MSLKEPLRYKAAPNVNIGTKVLTLSASNLERITLRLPTYYNAALFSSSVNLHMSLSASCSGSVMHDACRTVAFELNFELR